MDASPLLTAAVEGGELRTHDPAAVGGQTQNPALVVSDFDQPADLELPDNVGENVIVTQTQDSDRNLEPEHQ